MRPGKLSVAVAYRGRLGGTEVADDLGSGRWDSSVDSGVGESSRAFVVA